MKNKKTEQRNHQPKTGNEALCHAGFDRTVLGCTTVYMAALLKLPDFHCVRSHLIWRKRPNQFLPYERIHVLKSTHDATQIWVYSEPGSSRLDAYRVHFFPDDQHSLRPEHFFSVARLVEEPPRVRLLEVAFDFSAESGIDGSFVRAHGIFGKCRPYCVGTRNGWDAWGSRAGSKFVRSYNKTEIHKHRLEPQLQSRFLQEHQLLLASDLPKLANILPAHHIFFARLSQSKLNAALQNAGLPARQIQRTLRIVGGLEKKSLLAALRFLRREVGLTNVHRLVEPLEPENQLVRNALLKLADDWRREWTRLESEE